MYWDQFSRRHQVYCWLAAVFVSSLLIANLIGAYVFEIKLPFSLPVVGSTAILSSGIIPFPITFILTDLLNEYYGARGARFITYIGFGMSILIFLYLTVVQSLPASPDTVILPTQFKAFADNYSGMFVASLTAYLIGQLLDIKLFSIMKGITGNRFLGLRATGSTVLSQIIDTLLVTSIAFYDDMPWNKILHIASSEYAWKLLICLGITPILYAGHMFLKRFLRLEPEKARSEG